MATKLPTVVKLEIPYQGSPKKTLMVIEGTLLEAIWEFAKERRIMKENVAAHFKGIEDDLFKYEVTYAEVRRK